MTTQEHSTQSPMKSTDSPTTDQSCRSPLSLIKPLPSRDCPLSNTEYALIQSLRQGTIPCDSSIPLSLRITQKGVDIHCTFLVNHRSTGNLVIQVDEFYYIKQLFELIGIEILDESSNEITNIYARFAKRSHARQLHKP